MLYELETNKITEEQFDNEINQHEDKYVLKSNSIDNEEYEFLIWLTKTGLCDNVDEVFDDFCSVFEINQIEFDKIA